MQDHIVPLSKGGSRKKHNLCWSCSPCNHAKGDITLAEFRLLVAFRQGLVEPATIKFAGENTA
jgi:5-methylcytosine-specific restriction endonuclease McrA